MSQPRRSMLSALDATDGMEDGLEELSSQTYLEPSCTRLDWVTPRGRWLRLHFLFRVDATLRRDAAAARVQRAFRERTVNDLFARFAALDESARAVRNGYARRKASNDSERSSRPRAWPSRLRASSTAREGSIERVTSISYQLHA